MIYTAGNWSVKDDDWSEMFLLQNLKQFWLPEEISLTGDLLSWEEMSNEEQSTYMKVLGGLTLLDTIQGDVGMPEIAGSVGSHQQKAVLSFMGAMENAVHARSYSNIFLTLASQDEITKAFKWIENNPHLQKKADIIHKYYEKAQSEGRGSYMAKAASVALESFLFYSGFFYPLYLAGNGILRNSGEIIALIIRDESIHGVFVGLLAQQDIVNNPVELANVEEEVYEMFDALMENEIKYARELYDPIGLTHEAIDFVKYNANKALANLGFDERYTHEKVNPIVLNGLDTGGTAIDFFSSKGSMYKKATVVAIKDEDFIF